MATRAGFIIFDGKKLKAWKCGYCGAKCTSKRVLKIHEARFRQEMLRVKGDQNFRPTRRPHKWELRLKAKKEVFKDG